MVSGNQAEFVVLGFPCNNSLWERYDGIMRDNLELFDNLFRLSSSSDKSMPFPRESCHEIESICNAPVFPMNVHDFTSHSLKYHFACARFVRFS